MSAAIPSRIVQVSAFCASGRFRVIHRTPFSVRVSSSGSPSGTALPPPLVSSARSSQVRGQVGSAGRQSMGYGAPVGHNGRMPPLYGRDTVSWQLNRESVLLLGGPRALLLQVAHPAVAAGVADHSD